MGQPSARTTGAAKAVHTRDLGFSAASLVALRSDMLRFARLQVHDQALAEDLVQESLESALRKASSFAGDSSLKTWVFAILRNRIIDHHRRASRSINLSSLAPDDVDQDDCVDALFDAHGDWHPAARPSPWPTPDEALSSRRFRAALEASLQDLPAQARRVFMMREVLGLEAREIAEQLGISTNNCHVVLHRARAKLRAALEVHWDNAREAGPLVRSEVQWAAGA
jgi:RNA polymerase sigma-70 factor (ECF subfamily)